MLARTTYMYVLPILYGCIILYRISAGCCSIITGWVFADTFSLIIDNMPVFLCPFIIIRGGCFPFVKLVVGFYSLYFINN